MRRFPKIYLFYTVNLSIITYDPKELDEETGSEEDYENDMVADVII